MAKEHEDLQRLKQRNDAMLDELASDAEEYLALLEEARELPEGSDRRMTIEGELYGWIGALELHARHLRASIDEETDLEGELQERSA